MSISSALAHLSELVATVMQTGEHVTITKNGSTVAVIVSAQEWESIQETLFWQAQPGIHEDIAEARHAVETGELFSEAEVRSRYGVPLKIDPSGRSSSH